jgi:hypothetical protein
LNQQVDFYEIQYGGHVIKGDLDAIHFNPVPSSILKWRAFKLLRWIQNLNQSTWDHGILYADRSSKDGDGQLLMRPFCQKQKYERGGRLKVKIHILFYGDNSWTVAVNLMRFGIVEDHGHTYKFYFIHILFEKTFKYGDGAKF